MATSPNYGWEEPDDTDLVKDGALSIRTMGNAIDSTLGTALNNKLHAGLVLVKTQTIGTGVSSVTVTGAFSSTYESYRIIITGGAGSTDQNVGLKLGSSTTGYYDILQYASFAGTTQTNAGNNNGVNFAFTGNATSNGIAFDVNVKNPFLTRYTYVDSPYVATLAAGRDVGVHKVETSYTDFTLVPGATLTGGTIAVYGYAKD